MYEGLVKRLRNRANGSYEAKCEDCEFTEDFPPCVHCTIKAFNDAADAIEELDTLLDGVSADNDALCETIERLKKPRWISVTERLPEKAEQIADHWFSAEVIGKDEVTIRKAYYNFTAGVWLDANREMEWDSITHWMPMPQEEET